MHQNPYFSHVNAVKNCRLNILLSTVLCVFFSLVFLTARADDAPDITEKAHFSGSPAINSPKDLFDNRHISTWASKKGYLEITVPDEEPCFGVYLCFKDHATACEIQVSDGESLTTFRTIEAGSYAHQFIELPGVTRFRIVPTDTNEIMVLSELRLLGSGEIPSYVQRWEPPCDKADLMIIVAHPDDEYIWFGGTIPYYAIEENKKIQIVTMTCMTAYRKSELLDALWTGGIKNYPIIGSFADKKTDSTAKAVSAWGGSAKIKSWLVEIIRKYRPDVILTHAENGEYGHPAHIITSRYVRESLQLAADESFTTADDTLTPWQVYKGYMHHSGNATPICICWDMVISGSNGKTAFEIASEALLKHRSQHPLSQQMEQKGRYDCRLFDLFYSAVGDDVQKNDFFENIP